MTTNDPFVFLLDIDNTLLDNDRFAADLGMHLEQTVGAAERDRYWSLFADLRRQAGYADYLAPLQQLRVGLEDHPALLQLATFLLEYPFAERLYPQALPVIAHLNTLGKAVVLSDGDIIFQPRKAQRSGIWQAVSGRVLIYVHKELMLNSVRQRYPAAHYVMIDDKPHLLAAMKSSLGQQLTTVFVRQGHYAHAADANSIEPGPDVTIERLDALLGFAKDDFFVGENR